MAENNFLSVEIITPQKKIYSGKAASVSVPGSQSPFQILYNHAPIVSSLDAGVITINDDADIYHYFAISDGFLELSKNTLSILVELGLEASEINKESVEKQIAKLSEEREIAETKEKDVFSKKIKYAKVQLKAIELNK